MKKKYNFTIFHFSCPNFSQRYNKRCHLRSHTRVTVVCLYQICQNFVAELAGTKLLLSGISIIVSVRKRRVLRGPVGGALFSGQLIRVFYRAATKNSFSTATFDVVFLAARLTASRNTVNVVVRLDRLAVERLVVKYPCMYL